MLGFSTTGVNGQSSAANPIWIGDDGPYRADYSNVSGQDIVLVVWPSADSFVTSRQPAVTASLAAGDTITVSMLPGITGAWAGLYADTDLTSNGQIANTWGEFAAGGGGVVDVNRQYDMGGHFVSITTPGGCRSDLETCAFVCLAGESCTSGVELVNCDGAGTAVGGGVGGCPWGAGALRVELGV